MTATLSAAQKSKGGKFATAAGTVVAVAGAAKLVVDLARDYLKVDVPAVIECCQQSVDELMTGFRGGTIDQKQLQNLRGPRFASLDRAIRAPGN